MSNHNIAFNEDISKIIPKLSSNIHLISSDVKGYDILEQFNLSKRPFGPHHEKTCFLNMQKQRRRSDAWYRCT